MAEKTNFGPDFDTHLVPKKYIRGFYLYWMLYIVTSYHRMQFQRKLTNQPWENDTKNLVSGPILTHIAQFWAPKTFFVDFTSTRC